MAAGADAAPETRAETDPRRRRRRRRVASWLPSTAGIAFVALLLVTVVNLSPKAARAGGSVSSRPPLAGRTLREWATGTAAAAGNGKKKDDAAAIDDDITRDDACRDYLMQFLNGTTDAKDECTAMYKAYQVADCKDYSQSGGKGGGSQDGPHGDWPFAGLFAPDADKNKSTDSDDKDLMIDDAFEKWECCSSIEDYYGRHCREDQALNAVKLLGVVSVLVACGLLKTLTRLLPRLQWVPDAAACIVVGAFVGALLRLIGGQRLVTDKLAFDNDLFLHILLPPIIFQASLTIEKAAFRRDLFPILTFAVVGTFGSAVAIGYTTHALSRLPLLDSLLFGALMSSIDPVATLGILASVGVDQRDTLYTLVFGESLLNDGVAIVLFDSLVRHMGDARVVDQATVLDTLAHFSGVALGSILIGAAAGAAATLYFWLLRGMHRAVAEVGLFFAWAFIPYYIADAAGLSGIISIMVMGFVMDYYIVGGHLSEEGEWMEYMELASHDENGIHRSEHPSEPLWHQLVQAGRTAFSGRGLLLPKSRHHVGFVAEVISSLMETAIFAYLGLFLFNDRVWDVSATLAGLFACVSSRAAMVIVLSLLVNACIWIDLQGMIGRICNLLRYGTISRSGPSNASLSERLDDDSDVSDTKIYLDMKTQLILFSAGVRGAVSYALVQNIPVYDAVTETGSHYKAQLRSMTSFVIVILIFAFGALTYFSVKQDVTPLSDQQRVSSHRRLLSMGLSSEAGGPNDDESEYGYNAPIEQFEIDGRHTASRNPLNRE